MSQYQTRLPGGVRVRRPSTLNIYTGMVLLTFLVLAAGAAFLWMAAMQVAPTDAGHPFLFR
jgi:hypothetical protein